MLLDILLAAIFVVCIALVGVILLQRSEGGVLGMSGGGPGNFMSARGTGDLLTRTTQILAAIFFSLCLIMTLITGHMRHEGALADKLKSLTISPPSTPLQPAQPTPGQAAPAAPQPAAPLAPAAPAPAPAGDGLNLFGNASTGAPVAPHAPVQRKAAAVKPAPAPAAPPANQ
jgi:preprotein translocase subunit SecG